MSNKSRKYIKFSGLNPKNINYTNSVKSKITINSGGESSFYLLLMINELKCKYSLSTDEFLFLMYLYELGVFKNRLDVNVEHGKSLFHLVDKGFVDFYSEENNIYKLSDSGRGVIDDIIYEMNNYKTYRSRNRIIDLDIESKAEEVIKGFTF